MNEIQTLKDTGTELSDEVDADTNVFMVIVDDTPEAANALRYACNRARNRRGRVALLRVVEPQDFTHFLTVGEKVAAEGEAAARDLLQSLSEEVTERSGAEPIYFIEHGEVQQTVIRTLTEHPEVSIFVLAAASGSNPGPLIGALANRIINQVRTPIVLVPGELTLEEVDAIS